MPDFPPDADDVVTVASRQVDADHRSFELEGSGAGEAEAAGLPDLAQIEHEADLVAAMKDWGYVLTMVGGGAGGDELRRFYFRKA